MSRQLINEYRADLDRKKAVSGSRREGVLSDPFKDLLRRWGKSHDLIFVSQPDIVTAKGNRIYPDGALVHSLRVPFGYWEAKDQDDNLDKEIEAKFRKGYPKDNIIFSNDVTAVLYQDGHEVSRASMDDVDALLALLTRYFSHERAEIADFKKAVAQFKVDLPAVLNRLREIIQEKRAASSDFARAQDDFLSHARDAINPAVSEDDVQEMLIQHILTEDIFAKVFENPDFHRQNNVAAALYALEDKLFGYGEKQRLLKALGPYYAGIQSTAAMIESHSEKQGFLKGLYENFYKVYNPMAADRLGVVYTPGEIVRFMIRSADWLCEQHFGKNLIDKGVEILDPATGTGTFIVELLEHFRGDHAKLRHKYKEELHANEVAILPYYVANLNIEATYSAIMSTPEKQVFEEFENLCFVDTLDNVAALGIYAGHQGDMFGSVSDENMGRIKRQNERKISVIIGNPPYNANQQNENDNNKNRAYDRIDARIKQTYIKASTAQKTKLYDMYMRFFRWASDRLGDEGVIAYITNRSFIDASMADGFRRTVAKDFSEGWVVDLGGDYKKKGVGGTGNVFGIGTGVAVSFWVKRKGDKGKMKLSYLAAPSGSAEDKLSWVAELPMDVKGWQALSHRDDAAWVDVPDSDMSDMIPIADKKTKNQIGSSQDRSIFKLYSLGASTNRDEWLYDPSKATLADKASHLIETYNALPRNTKDYPATLKWSETLKRRKASGQTESFQKSNIRRAAYRPFSTDWIYQSRLLIDRPGAVDESFPVGSENRAICYSDPTSQKPFLVAGVDGLVDLHFVGAAAGTIYTPRYRYTKSGERVENITDWAVAQFRGAYGDKPLPFRGGVGVGDVSESHPLAVEQRTAPTPTPPLKGRGSEPSSPLAGEARDLVTKELSRSGEGALDVSHPLPTAPSPAATKATPSSLASPSLAPSPARGEGGALPSAAITKDAIFAYCYAVLHDPLYREKYALNLKREFPRIPFYPDFAQWVAWGEALLKLHIDYEDAVPFKLKRIDTPNQRRAEGTHPKPKLKSDPATGNIQIDEDTQLTGIPAAAWDYRLGNRSAIDWVLDQHKEKTPRDPTIRAKFNTYRFADYKENCIALLAKVVRVSVETVAITGAMRALARDTP